jgi:2-oxoglutarate ferredoxin oxidoreductase subunit alpha
LIRRAVRRGFTAPSPARTPSRYGLVAGAQLAELPMFFGGYPITPASAILHALSKLKEFGVTTFQAEDEIAAIASAIGASYAGQLGVTSSSGPGIALKGEAMGLAIMTELPLVIVNVAARRPFDRPADQDRAVGPLSGSLWPQRRRAAAGDRGALARRRVRVRDRGMPHRGAVHDPGDAADGRLYRQRRGALESAGWRSLAPFPVEFLKRAGARRRPLQPYARDEKGAAVDQARHAGPDAPHRRHREAGDTGHIDYSPANHQAMTDLRREARSRASRIAFPIRRVASAASAASSPSSAGARTFGPIHQAVRRARAKGQDVSHVHIRHIWPMPKNLGELLKGYDKILVPEMNTGQFKTVLRDQYLVDARPLNKTSGQPFRIAEIEAAIEELLN